MADIQAINPIMNGVFWASAMATISLTVASRDRDTSLGFSASILIAGIFVGLVLHALPLEGIRFSFVQAGIAWTIAYSILGAIVVLLHLPFISSTLPEPLRSDQEMRAKMLTPTIVGVVVLALALVPLRSAYNFFAPAVLDARAKAAAGKSSPVAPVSPKDKLSTTSGAAPPSDGGATYSDAAVTAAAVQAVKAKLVDPGSAKFRNLSVHTQASGTKAVCGEVNSRNRAGGYSGFERFISAGTADRTYFASDLEDIGSAWAALCRN